jgi:hypothetical protein
MHSTALSSMREATAEDALMAELSNLLHHLYRLRELCKRRLGSAGFYAMERSTPELRAARAAGWARNFDTHRLFSAGSLQGVYSDFCAAIFGVLVWESLSSLPESTDKYDRHLDYEAELDGKPILDTLRNAFDAMAGLL